MTYRMTPQYGSSDIVLLSQDGGATWKAHHATEAAQSATGSTREEAIGRLILGSPNSFGITIDSDAEEDRPFYVKRSSNYHAGDGRVPEWGMREDAAEYTKAEAYSRRAEIAPKHLPVFAERGQSRL